VDDSKAVLTNTARLLTDNGFRTIMAEDGLKALKVLQNTHRQEKIDLIVTDIEMPEMDGLEFASKIRESEYKEIPVLLYTSLTDRFVESAAQMVKAAGYLRKNDTKNLVNKIKDILGAKAKAS
jgi:CheY-like chemotaxis protein